MHVLRMATLQVSYPMNTRDEGARVRLVHDFDRVYLDLWSEVCVTLQARWHRSERSQGVP